VSTTTSTTTARTEYREAVELERLVPHAGNVRRDLGDLTELAASIAEVGVLEPLLVAPAPEPIGQPGDLLVIAGHRRLAAAQIACVPAVPCLVRGDLTAWVDILTAMLTENLHRSDLTPIEEAVAYEQLQLAGLDVPAIAKRTGRGRRTVEQRLQLMGLPDQVRDKVHARQITIGDAAALLEFTDDPARLQELERHLGTSNWRWQLESSRRSREQDRRKDAARAKWEAQGVRILAPADTRGNDMWRHTLGRLGVVPQDESLTADQRRSAEDEHSRTCPAAAVEITPGGYVEHYCLDPTLHGITLAAPATETVAAACGVVEDQEAAAAREAEVAACEVAARLRKAHVQAFLDGATQLTDDMRTAITARTAVLCAAVCEPFYRVDITDIAADLGADLAVAEQDTEGSGYDDWQEGTLLAGHITTMRDPHLALLALISRAGETDLDKPMSWRAEHATMSLKDLGSSWYWLRLLGGPLGYEWSDWEAERLDQITAAHETASPAADVA
jgi:ParB/RepB/Spo0J family partition protein